MKRVRRRALREHGGRPGDAEAQNVAHVVAGVGQQRDGIAEQTVDHLQNHEAGVEGDPDGERLAETRGRVDVAVAAVMVWSCPT